MPVVKSSGFSLSQGDLLSEGIGDSQERLCMRNRLIPRGDPAEPELSHVRVLKYRNPRKRSPLLRSWPLCVVTRGLAWGRKDSYFSWPRRRGVISSPCGSEDLLVKEKKNRRRRPHPSEPISPRIQRRRSRDGECGEQGSELRMSRQKCLVEAS